MSKLFLSGMVSLVASTLVAADFPEGTGAIEITEPGTYTATEDRTIESLVVATPTGTADAHTVTVFDHTAVPERKISLTLDTKSALNFNVANHYNDVWIKGGLWDFAQRFYLGNENSSTEGRDAFRRLYLTDGATLSGDEIYVNFGTGGSEFYISNATVSAFSLYVQNASAMTTSTATDLRGKLLVGAGGKLNLSSDLYVQYEYTSSNSRHAGYAQVSGIGAAVEANNIYLKSAPLTRASVGTEMRVEDGGSVVAAGTIGIGSLSYTYNPKLFDAFYANDATVTTKNMYVGQGAGVTNALAVISNSAVTVSGDLIVGDGANTVSNRLLLIDCAQTQLTDDLRVGSGAGSHDNFVGLVNCGTIPLTTKFIWYAGYGENSYNNTILISNTVVRTDREVGAGGRDSSHDNEVVVAGHQGAVVMTLKQRDPLAAGYRNRFRVTDNANLTINDTSLWLFKSASDSELVVEKGGRLAAGEGKTLSVVAGKITSTGVTSGNKLIVRDAGSCVLGGELSIGGTNTEVVVRDGLLDVPNHLTVGASQSVDDLTAPARGCKLVVGGTSPKISIGKNLKLESGAESVLRFELGGDGYAWADEPARKAPVVLTASSTYTVIVNDDSILEADVSRLNPAARDRPIAVATSKVAMNVSETALANANARGALAKKPYHFSLSDDKKTLFVTAESKGLMLLLR